MGKINVLVFDISSEGLKADVKKASDFIRHNEKSRYTVCANMEIDY